MEKIGIIGGTGVKINILDNLRQIKLNTPYGPTSDLITLGTLEDKEIVFIPRHGYNHSINPSNVPYKANIYAMKELGVTRILAPCAVGSLKEEIIPGSFVFTDQFIDRTTKRDQTFYNGNQVAHIPMGNPFCPELRNFLAKSASSLKLNYRKQGTNIVIEGPRFSTIAESNLFRSWNIDTINMTMIPEVVLAREMQICYASIAMVIDYDSWKDKIVDVPEILSVMKANSYNVQELIKDVIKTLPEYKECNCSNAIEGALL